MNAICAVAGVAIRELYRRKDFYVLFFLMVIIALTMGCGNLINDAKREGYLKEICLLLIWISSLLIAISTAARQLPAERESRTLFPLLAKPVTRVQVIVGKFLGCWLACGAALVVFYFILGVVSASREHEWRVLEYAQALWLQWIFLAVVIALGLWGSITFATPAANATICLIVIAGVLVLQRHLNDLALARAEPMRSFLYAIYFTLPRPEWFDLREPLIFHRGWPGGGEFAAVSLYGAAYTAFFLLAAWVGFRRKSLAS
jgi:ABC-type transport system involved in multi-copper enzyme maturation permease subunit